MHINKNHQYAKLMFIISLLAVFTCVGRLFNTQLQCIVITICLYILFYSILLFTHISASVYTYFTSMYLQGLSGQDKLTCHMHPLMTENHATPQTRPSGVSRLIQWGCVRGVGACRIAFAKWSSKCICHVVNIIALI